MGRFSRHIFWEPLSYIVSTDAEVNKVVLQNHGNTFIPAYPKSIKELLGKNSILQINGSLHKRVHGLIGGFLKSPQFKARITRDIENSVKLNLAGWTDHMHHPIYIQDETQKVLSVFQYIMFIRLSITFFISTLTRNEPLLT